MALRTSIPARLLEHSQLRPLLAHVRSDGTVGRAFFRAYFRSTVSYGTRSLALRLVLEDHRSWNKGCGLPPLSPALLGKIVAYLDAHPRSPLRPFGSYCGTHDLPSHLGRMFGRWPMWGNELVRRAIVQPYFRAVQRHEPFPDVAGNVTSREARAILSAPARQSILTSSAADRLLNGRFTTHVPDYFFNTGVAALDARNILMFAAELLGRRGESRALKSKIPVPLTRRLGTRRICLPDMMFAADILALAALGALPLMESRAGPLEEIAEAVARPSQGLARAIPDLRDLAQGHFRRSMLDDAACRSLREALDKGTRWYNLYHTGLVFNPERLVRGGRTHGGFDRFRPFYDNLSTIRMRALVIEHYRRIDEEFADALQVAMREAPAEFRGVGVRSLANCLFFARWVAQRDEEPRVVLPTVAQFRLGRPESLPSGRRNAKRTRHRIARRPPNQRVVRPLPLFDELTVRVPGLAS